MLALNVVMMVSTVPEGGHYLVDVVAGILTAIVCIAVHARIFESNDRQLSFEEVLRGDRDLMVLQNASR